MVLIEETAAPVSPWRFKPFRWQFFAQGTTILGSTLSPVALSLGVLKATGSTKDLSLILVASALPTVIFLLAGGVWADRLPRNRVMIGACLVAGVAQGVLGVTMIGGHFVLWQALALQFVSGTALAFYFPAAIGLTAVTVPSESLQKANAWLSLMRSLAGASGPLTASVLVITVGAGWALVLDCLCYFACAAMLTRIVIPRNSKPSDRDSFVKDLATGFREVMSRTWVWSSIGVFMCGHLAMASFFVLGPMLMLGRGGGEVAWGALIASMSAGQMIGDVAAMRLTPKRPMITARLVELLAAPLLFALAFSAPLPLLIATGLLAGISITFPDSLWYTALQRNLAPTVLSRVSSYDWMGSLSLRPIGYVAAAAFATSIGVAETLAIGAVLIVVSRLAGLLGANIPRGGLT